MQLNLLTWIFTAVYLKGLVVGAASPDTQHQRFAQQPSAKEVNPGDTALLNCKVLNRRGECAWLKDGRVVGRIEGKYDFLREPSNGDCSIKIHNSKIEEDDGLWQCQVTQTSFTESSLTSPDVKFTVREPPIPPRIEDNTQVLQPGEPYPTQAGKHKRLHCVSRKGNPPAFLRWFIDDTEITGLSNQTNTTDVEKVKTWQAVSVLDYVFQKEHNRKSLKCVAVHPAYGSVTKEIRLSLDVLYVPEIRLEGSPSHDIEEGDSVSVSCIADSNPPARLIWKKSGYSSIYSLKDQIEFRPAKRSDSAIYSCSATNDVGQSPELQVSIDVKYKPQILKISPNPGVTVNIYNSTIFVCEAEGNPTPQYSWLQRMGGDPVAWQQREKKDIFHIQNVTYQYQGQYVCEATNVINGRHYKATSAEISLDVTGAPQVLTDTSRTKRRVVVEKDDDALIAVFFCSDPVPRRTYWEWGSIKLDSGDVHVRYIAEELRNDESEKDCYEARLIIRTVDGSDSRKYTLHVENDKGNETFAVLLEVREPVAMSVVIGIVIGSIILLVIITLVILYLLKAERMCFNRRRTTITGKRSSKLTQNGHGKGAIPPDALYAGEKKKKQKRKSEEKLVLQTNGDGVPNKTDNRNPSAVVYACLDLPNPDDISSQNRPKNNFRAERTEYAEIKFHPDVSEQADI